MKNFVLILAVLCMALTGCTADQAAVSSAEAEQWNALKIPQEKHICTVYNDYKNYSVAQLQMMYKQDMAAAENTYSGTLNSMWYDIICARIGETYNNKRKLAFLQQEANRSSLVPSFGAYYNLLATCKGFKDTDKLNAMADAVYNKSKAIIENKPDVKAKDNLMLSLNYSKRIYTILVSTPTSKGIAR